MLQSFRERMQGIIAWTIVIAICITFALWGVQNYLRDSSRHDVVAKINGVKITQKQLEMAYGNLRKERMYTQGADFMLDQQAQLELKKTALQGLIKNAVLTQYINKLKLYASLPQVRATVYTLPIFKINGAFSPDRYQQALSNMGYTEEMFVEELQKSITLDQLELGLRNSAFVLPSEIQVSTQLNKQQRDFVYALLDPKKIAKSIVVTDADVKEYYEKNRDHFVTPEQVSVEYVQLDKAAIQSNVASDVAKGKNKAQSDLAHQQVLQQFAEANDKMADIAYTNSDSLKPVADALGLRINETELFTNAGSKTGLAANPKIVKAAFSELVLKQGYNSNPIEITPSNVIVLRIKKHVPEQSIPLPQVQQEIKNILLKERMDNAAKNLAQQVVADLQNGVNLSEVKQKYALNFISVAKAERERAGGTSAVNAKVLQSVFTLVPQANGKVAARFVRLDNGTYAVVSLVKVYIGDIPTKLDNKPALQQNIELQYGDFERSMLLHDVRSKAKIKVEDSNISMDDRS